MPQAASFTVQDRESTPANHVFSPNGENELGTWEFLNKAVEYPAGRERVRVRLIDATRKKVRFVLRIPVIATQTINGVSTPVEVRASEANVEFNFDAYSTLQERKNLVGMVYNSLATGQTMLNTIFTDLEDLF